MRGPSLEDLFHLLAPLPIASRSFALDSLSTAQRNWLEPMLRHHDAARQQTFLEPSCLARSADTCPEHIGPYRILGVLGKGGMGTVYRAEHRTSGQPAAVKICARSVLAARQHAASFVEGSILRALDHRCICRVYETGCVDTAAGMVPYLAMELVLGPNLLDHATAVPLNLEMRMRLLARTADAVHYLHERGIAHRDLKPRNILVDATADPVGQPKLLDFGAAGRLGERAVAHVGTPLYMSPEQLDPDAPIDARGDVFALGVIGMELASGQPTGELLAVLSLARAQAVSERLQSAAELASALRQCSTTMSA